eukprot:TRINITY_DN28477_c0_g1_i1.p1 TRINITY_DN28477_c0_g1~~TRINITY_DN28477_c0_g1_i1.p1  ORF type:complete len:516 (-),score=151.74 TRINITY_DN28477_c0_g1_i1:292-1671(-)
MDFARKMKEAEEKESKLQQTLNAKKSELRELTADGAPSTTVAPPKAEKKKFNFRWIDTAEPGRRRPTRVGVIEAADNDRLYSSKSEDAWPRLSVTLSKLRPEPFDSSCLARVTGPQNSEVSLEQPSAERYRSCLYARTVSTYPIHPSKQKRDGDPVCDRFNVQLFRHRAVLALGDGCNWGPRPRDAAARATEAFVGYFANTLPAGGIPVLKDVGPQLLKALATAQNAIVDGKDDPYEAGTTTFLGGLLLQLQPNELDVPWVFVCVSVGDCKAFHWSAKTRRITDITESNRCNSTDATDPGGRLGPQLSEGAPDLRNMELYFEEVHEGDVVFMVSDGVHDNIDPQQLGLAPDALHLKGANWKEAEKLHPSETETAKNIFRRCFLEKEFGALLAAENADTLLPEALGVSLIERCQQITEPSRAWMEENPNKKLPENYTQYPGKMDHTTVIAISIPSSVGFV